jgi:hypothetical protein
VVRLRAQQAAAILFGTDGVTGLHGGHDARDIGFFDGQRWMPVVNAKKEPRGLHRAARLYRCTAFDQNVTVTRPQK